MNCYFNSDPNSALAKLFISSKRFLQIFLDSINFSQSVPRFLIIFTGNLTMRIQQSDKIFSLIDIFSNIKRLFFTLPKLLYSLGFQNK